jgi:hypothetical protein
VTGLLVPPAARVGEDEPEDDEMDAGSDEDDVETHGDEPAPTPRALLASSVGLSVLLPPGRTTDTVEDELRWATSRIVLLRAMIYPAAASVSPARAQHRVA